jgi:hypothetical protein
VESYLVGLASRHPGLVRLERLEETHEGRSVLAVRIGNSTLGKEIGKKSHKTFSMIYFFVFHNVSCNWFTLKFVSRDSSVRWFLASSVSSCLDTMYYKVFE